MCMDDNVHSPECLGDSLGGAGGCQDTITCQNGGSSTAPLTAALNDSGSACTEPGPAIIVTNTCQRYQYAECNNKVDCCTANQQLHQQCVAQGRSDCGAAPECTPTNIDCSQQSIFYVKRCGLESVTFGASTSCCSSQPPVNQTNPFIP